MKIKYKLLRFLGYKTFAEMNSELRNGKRKQISYKDGQKASALERALYSKEIRYPKTGDIYISIKEAEISYMTHWMKPYTGGEKSIFPANEKIKISEISKPKPTGVYCVALHSDKIEKLMVPQSDREQHDYNGYSLFVDTLILNQKFRLIDNNEA